MTGTTQLHHRRRESVAIDHHDGYSGLYVALRPLGLDGSTDKFRAGSLDLTVTINGTVFTAESNSVVRPFFFFFLCYSLNITLGCENTLL